VAALGGWVTGALEADGLAVELEQAASMMATVTMETARRLP
jgi:hypothetical protein